MAFNPIQGNILAEAEIHRRQLALDAGPVATGYLPLDDALGGGFSRGSVVGISAHDENSVALPVRINTYHTPLFKPAADKISRLRYKL